jgi:hypothetical protein
MTLQEAIELKSDCIEQIADAKSLGRRDWVEALEKRLAALKATIARKRAERVQEDITNALQFSR